MYMYIHSEKDDRTIDVLLSNRDARVSKTFIFSTDYIDPTLNFISNNVVCRLRWKIYFKYYCEQIQVITRNAVYV